MLKERKTRFWSSVFRKKPFYSNAELTWPNNIQSRITCIKRLLHPLKGQVGTVLALAHTIQDENLIELFKKFIMRCCRRFIVWNHLETLLFPRIARQIPNDFRPLLADQMGSSMRNNQRENIFHISVSVKFHSVQHDAWPLQFNPCPDSVY
jgi:hypothetical protein